MPYSDEIEKRRTFAIISHPDAGKTTLTEKLLLFGGAIQVAGAVKSNKTARATASDFMEIERQRGISVATSVMGFEYNGYKINLLDTPGHKDFSEDTYRTLTAVDSVVLVVDCVKGVEEQTEKLMNVCRMRKTPVIVFVNKLDREGKDPFDLLDELEAKLSIKVRPLSWPIGMGTAFKGVYNLYNKSLYLFRSGGLTRTDDVMEIRDLGDAALDRQIGDYANKLREDAELVEGAYDDFDRQTYLAGDLAPVFFGSAVNNFGVKELLDTLTTIAPPPANRATNVRVVESGEKNFTGFVFKIHANLDPRHRDRIAFVRICSGRFERSKFFHHVRLNKDIRFTSPVSFMAMRKSIIDEAYPGDVIGLYDTGVFKIGDTLTEGEKFMFQGIPSFSPEVFKLLVNLDPAKSKQLNKGIAQLTDEGVAQLFTQQQGSRKIVGTVGVLQFDVLQYRLEHEYGARCRFEPLGIHKACWITSESKADMDKFVRFKSDRIAEDKDGNLVFLAESEWALRNMIEATPEITFHFTSEFKREMQNSGPA
ncbi:MAG: peptide chain release factor 3 [Nitrospirae bacterium GWC2_57_13]|jgi:peptide chain release factor 3|nr:MAG: peptide chain release factor 3 [Nitrospirae bacterium GWC1_57_7]OGW27212.1 MAG: peptide chain release factor 3 [Nitrospirae bacterium GWC2_57_13]OGW45798.1 MAG: peptide chain release factor 3 [Nitrospirae bacterium GWD2_57_8]